MFKPDKILDIEMKILTLLPSALEYSAVISGLKRIFTVYGSQKGHSLIYQDLSVDFIQCGIGKKRAVNTLKNELMKNNYKLIIVAGCCGALQNRYRPGDVIVPSFVINDHGNQFRCVRFEFDSEQRIQTVLSVNKPADRDKKSLISSRHPEASAVDMESYWLGKYALEADLPFLTVRGIVDTFADDIPDFTIKRKAKSLKQHFAEWKYMRAIKKSCFNCAEKLASLYSEISRTGMPD